uniref:Uncharacterized protein n=1 Tax=Salix viminalis TaxID=40686 RepID=A0A6N2M158_SALVM
MRLLTWVVHLGSEAWKKRFNHCQSRFSQHRSACFHCSLDTLISGFQKKGLLQGHGCFVRFSYDRTSSVLTFSDRIYSDSNIDAGFASTRKRRCPRTGGQENLAPLDWSRPTLLTTTTSIDAKQGSPSFRSGSFQWRLHRQHRHRIQQKPC